MASDLDFENLFLKHRFTSPFAFDDLPPKMWQNSHGNWRVHPQCHPFSRKEGIFWGIIQIFKDGTLKITIIFRYWWIWLGIQGLFGCLSTLLATDFRENDWPFDLYLLTDTYYVACWTVSCLRHFPLASHVKCLPQKVKPTISLGRKIPVFANIRDPRYIPAFMVYPLEK